MYKYCNLINIIYIRESHKFFIIKVNMIHSTMNNYIYFDSKHLILYIEVIYSNN